MYDIRRAMITDSQAISDIENQAGFSHWNENQLKQAIERDIVWVVEEQRQLKAFVVLSHVLDESELLNIVVVPAEQGRGIAFQLLKWALADLAMRGVIVCFLEVAASNATAIRLYEKIGFEQIGVRKNYYLRPYGKEDALLMQLQLQNAATNNNG